MSATAAQNAIAVVGIDIGKNSFRIVALDHRGAIVSRQKWSRGQVEARFANMPPCLIGMEACVGAHHLSRKLKAFGHDAKLMPVAIPSLKHRRFDTDLIDSMSAAYATVCHALGLSTKPDSATEIVALKIMEIAARGARSPTEIHSLAMEELHADLTASECFGGMLL
jgi:transposase